MCNEIVQSFVCERVKERMSTPLCVCVYECVLIYCIYTVVYAESTVSRP